MKLPTPRVPELFRCSFCGKSDDVVSRLISSPSKWPLKAYICEECIVTAMGIIFEEGVDVDPGLLMDMMCPISRGCDTLEPQPVVVDRKVL